MTTARDIAEQLHARRNESLPEYIRAASAAYADSMIDDLAKQIAGLAADIARLGAHRDAQATADRARSLSDTRLVCGAMYPADVILAALRLLEAP